jgi:hypothetical protein
LNFFPELSDAIGGLRRIPSGTETFQASLGIKDKYATQVLKRMDGAPSIHIQSSLVRWPSSLW